MNILIVEDNRDIAENIADYLEPLGYTLDFAVTGRGGLELATRNRYDVIVLDVMLPGMDGFAVCRALRDQSSAGPPILMLTARDQLDDKLQGFAAGADDYLVKPFSIRELEARLNALVNRHQRREGSDVLTVGPLSFDLETLHAQREGVALELNPIQRKLLQILMRNSHRVVTRDELEQQVWGDDPPDKDILRTHIYALRAVIDKPFSEKLLQTVHGTGYRLAQPAEGELPR
ncbi:response regulator transcription factor [Pseudohongiella spirulinae]|jgi:DNA-binding response OmpR family regulator|uniref:Two-component system regulatory protein n=1 Tax=Pseudohongiella spirulinae TaxID=1249552 RepID=A0A0S2KET4_9GAMM|nr:response regulator transcription factor [Pseudohongiella spirulinae]ALO46855.1 Two-component system regulatory protein [Pseudohongiella spirulinae]